MKSLTLNLALLVAASPLALVSAPALAQSNGAAAAGSVNDYGEIVVSARRRDETLQSTPVAITAVNAAMLENKATINVGDLTGQAPNLLITNQNSGAAAANISIRGLTYANVEKSQDPTVGVVIDGVFIGTSTGQFLDFFDIDQVEVLRGPQGTLFGRNTIGGVINIKRTRPTGEFGVKAEVSYGKFNTFTSRVVVNAPIIPGLLSAKAFYFHDESDGYYTQAQTGKPRGFNSNDNFGVSFLLKPEGSGFDALLTLEKQKQTYDPVIANIAKTGEVFCGFELPGECNRNTRGDVYTIFGQPAVGYYSAPAATLEMNYDAGPIKLTSITGFRKSNEDQTQDYDGSAVDLYYTHRIQHYHQWSEELRAAGKVFDGLDYVVGGYYFYSKYDNMQASRVFAFAPTIDPIQYDKNPQFVVGTVRSLAAFADFDWSFAPKWRLSFGGRFTSDKKFLSNSFGGVPIGQGSATFNKFTPKVGIDYRPTDEVMLYASWSRGFRSGGFSPRAGTAASAAISYKPETVDSYEIGTKLNLFDRHLQFNVAAFYSKYKNLQQDTTLDCPACATGDETITENVGSATIKGIEVDFTARAGDHLRINGSMGLLKSNFKDFIVGGLSPVTGLVVPYNYSNNDLIYNPTATASLGGEYTQPTDFGSVIGNIGWRYISPYDQQISIGGMSGNLTTGPITVLGNDPRVRTNAQQLIDASLTTNFKVSGVDFKFTVFGRNLFDDRGTNHAFTVGTTWAFATAREPRTFGGTIGVKF